MISIVEALNNPSIKLPDKLSNTKNIFVIQHHISSLDHYDIRLERNGVLVSWATRKLPDLINNKVKKIAIFKQPDHELEWSNFQGEIKDGYGKGTVSIYDNGKYDTIKWADHIIINFHGKILNGTYVLIPTQYGKEQWLMFKYSKE